MPEQIQRANSVKRGPDCSSEGVTKKQKSGEITEMIKDMDNKQIAAQGIKAIDNTSLDLSKETEESIKALCAKSTAAEPSTAAVCIFPKWIKLCKETLKDTGVTVATVVNFPLGKDPTADVEALTKQAVEDGVDEVDLVIDYAAIIANKEEGVAAATELVKKIKAVCGSVCLKVIIEAGELKTEELVKAASNAAIAGGCNFIKTSTGKVPVNATEENSRWMLETLVEAEKGDFKGVGFKAAGGVKTVEATKTFLCMAEELMGTNFVQTNFRFGASSLLSVLRGCVAGDKVEGGEGY